MNIYLQELRAHRKSLIIWSVSMVLLIIAGMGKFSAGVGAGAGSFNEMMEQLPDSIQNLMGVGVFDLSKPLDFYGVLFLHIGLLATVYSVMLGVGIISKEERDKTIEFLAVKPVSRHKIITSKLLAALSMVLIFNIVTFTSSLIMISNYTNEPFVKDVFMLMLGLLAMQIIFTVLGTFLAALISKSKLSSAISTGVLMFLFMISVIIDIAGNVDFLKFITPFKYYDAKDILKGGYNTVYPLISVILVIIFTYGTYYFYKKRDLRV
ncbi:MAG: ABC transporter permease subunit [Eubacteriales bacterium]